MHAEPVSAPLKVDPREAGTELRRIRWDTWSGMFYSDLYRYSFIVLATAVTLNVAGITQIETAAQLKRASGRSPAISPSCCLPASSSGLA